MKFKQFFSIILFLTLITCAYSQSKLSFTATYQNRHHPLDSIVIKNLNTGSRVVKYYPDTVLTLLITGTRDIPYNQGFRLPGNYPNPFSEMTRFNLHLPYGDLVNISVYSISGKLLLDYKRDLPAGNHTFSFSGSSENIYLLSARTEKYSASAKLIYAGGYGTGAVTIEYEGYEGLKPDSRKGDAFIYNHGDMLEMKGYLTNGAGLMISDTLTDDPSESRDYSFNVKNPNRIVILMYHEITDSIPDDEYKRNITDFENDLKYVRDQNYQVLSMNDLPLVKAGLIELISDGLVITFDDGYDDNYDFALPLLDQYQMPAVFFIVTEWMGTTGFMTWPKVWQISEFIDTSGKHPFKIGSHSSSHPFLGQSAQYFPDHNDYMTFLNTELGDSKTWITDVTGQDTTFLSLPYGDGANNADIIESAAGNGYTGIRTSVWNSFSPDSMNLFSLPSLPVLSNTKINIIENYLNP
jgi:peptidoglycan/xylan/chitin deacetylase (PgdA/CDA1 family)